MNFNNSSIDRTYAILNAISKKQEVAATNVTNSNTPGYVRKDVSFSQILASSNTPLETKLAEKIGPNPFFLQEEGQVDLKKELAGVEYEKKVLETGNVAEKNNLGATWIMDARYLTDNQFIGFGNDANRLISVSGKTVKETYQEFPNIDADQETNWSIWNNMSKFCVSPDKEKLVISTYIGSMIQIFNISGGIRPKALKTFYKPMYSYAQGATPKCVISNEQTIFGSQSLYTCPKSFLVNIAGTNHKFDEILFRYDYDGKIQTSYNIGRVPMCMCLDDSGNLYFLADDKDAEEIQLYTGTL